LVAWLPVGCQLDMNGTAVTLTLEEHVSVPSPKSRAKGIGTVAQYWSALGRGAKGHLLTAAVKGFGRRPL
jgi:hypothetical protein